MRRAKDQLDGERHRELIEDIATFNKQEAQHFKQHAVYNKAIRDQGYEGMAAIEEAYEADYERFLASRSLKFNVAYCEGFEALGAVSAPFFLDACDDLLAGADPAVTELWAWHLAEEFEHRSVCHEVYRSLYGRGWTRGYFYRVWAFFYAVRHINGHVARLNRYLLATDRARMTPDEQARSKRREKQYNLRRARHSLPRMLKVLSPWYDPAKLQPPARLQTWLDRY
jgi:predicted metal-dependent hydrolase